MAKISIITPSFNRADLINETAMSIFNQNYRDWEWVIVDDGSTDDSWKLLQNYAKQDSRVKVFQRNRAPKGACTCRNIAVEKSSGDYLLFLDTDDLLAPYCLEQRIKAMRDKPESDFIIFPALLFKVKNDDLRLLWNVDDRRDDIDRLLTGDPICQGTGLLWKKQSFITIGMWDENLLIWQDVELHLRSLLKGLAYQKKMDLQPDIFIRISDLSISRAGFHSYPKFRSRLQVFKQILLIASANNLVNAHYFGFQYMYNGLVLESILGRYWLDFFSLLLIGKKPYSFNKKIITAYLKLAIIWLTRLYKLSFFNAISEKLKKKIVGHAQYTLGTVRFEGHIDSL